MVLHSEIDLKTAENFLFKDDNLLSEWTLKKTLIFVLFAMTTFSIIKIQNDGGVMENSGKGL